MPLCPSRPIRAARRASSVGSAPTSINATAAAAAPPAANSPSSNFARPLAANTPTPAAAANSPAQLVRLLVRTAKAVSPAAIPTSRGQWISFAPTPAAARPDDQHRRRDHVHAELQRLHIGVDRPGEPVVAAPRPERPQRQFGEDADGELRQHGEQRRPNDLPPRQGFRRSRRPEQGHPQHDQPPDRHRRHVAPEHGTELPSEVADEHEPIQAAPRPSPRPGRPPRRPTRRSPGNRRGGQGRSGSGCAACPPRWGRSPAGRRRPLERTAVRCSAYSRSGGSSCGTARAGTGRAVRRSGAAGLLRCVPRPGGPDA